MTTWDSELLKVADIEKLSKYITDDPNLKKELERILPNKNFSIELSPYDNKFDMIHLSHDHYNSNKKQVIDEIKKVKESVKKHLEKKYKISVTASTYYYTDYEIK